MPSPSPALLPTPADRRNHAGIPFGCRSLSPDGESRPDIQRQQFELQLSHNHELLYFIACRILNRPQEAEDAVKNCLRTAASCNPPECSSEGAFKSWLVRILIDEATLLRNQQQTHPAQAAHISTAQHKCRYFIHEAAGCPA